MAFGFWERQGLNGIDKVKPSRSLHKQGVGLRPSLQIYILSILLKKRPRLCLGQAFQKTDATKLHLVYAPGLESGECGKGGGASPFFVS